MINVERTIPFATPDPVFQFTIPKIINQIKILRFYQNLKILPKFNIFKRLND